MVDRPLGYFLTGAACLIIGGTAAWLAKGSRETTSDLEHLSVDVEPPAFQGKVNKLGFPDIIAGYRGADGKQVGEGVRVRGIAPGLYSSDADYQHIKNHTQQRLTLRGPKPPKPEEEEKPEVKVEEENGNTVTITGGATFDIQGPATLTLQNPNVNYANPSQQPSLEPVHPSHNNPSSERIPTPVPENTLPPVQAPQHYQPTPGPTFGPGSYNNPTTPAPGRQASYQAKDLVNVVSTQVIYSDGQPLDVGGWKASSN